MESGSAPSQEQLQEQALPQIDSQALASALVGAMQQAGVVGNVSIVEETITSLPSPAEDTEQTNHAEQADAIVSVPSPCSDRQSQRQDSVIDEGAEVKIARAYEALTAERVAQQDSKAISARELELRAKVRFRRAASDYSSKKSTVLMVR